MATFRIDPVHEADLPAIADFLETAARMRPDASELELADTSAPAVLRRLRWRLLQNPARRDDLELGQVVRDDSGRVQGVHLLFPSHYRHGARRLLGVCSGYFFVAPEARMQGFFMFRRTLGLKGIDLLFATTCNANSAALWAKVGGQAVPGSEYEYLLPVRFGPVAEEVVLRKGWGKAAATAARMAGTIVSPMMGLGGGGPWRLAPTDDFAHLAAIAEENRDPAILAADRSAPYLRWRFADTPQASSTDLLVFSTASGRSGWVAARRWTRGRRGQIRALLILDAVAPSDGFDPSSLYASLVDHYAGRIDLISAQGDPRFWGMGQVRRLHARHLGNPRAFARGSLDGLSAASLLRLMPADGDTCD